MRCRLCGHTFDASQLACHTECPMGKHCTLICCPNCGYQVVDESKSIFARILSRFRPTPMTEQPTEPVNPVAEPADNRIIPLTHIPAGRAVEINRLSATPASRLTQLSLFGLMPGAQVEVLQHRPAPIIRIGETELALGREVLDQIWVNLE